MTELAFSSKKLLDGTLVGPDGTVWYTLDSHSGFRGRKSTTIRAASGAVGAIDWREKTFTINGVQRSFKEIRKSLFMGNWRGKKWRWGKTTYLVKFKHMQKEIRATPEGISLSSVRFTVVNPVAKPT